MLVYYIRQAFIKTIPANVTVVPSAIHAYYNLKTNPHPAMYCLTLYSFAYGVGLHFSVANITKHFYHFLYRFRVD